MCNKNSCGLKLVKQSFLFDFSYNLMQYYAKLNYVVVFPMIWLQKVFTLKCDAKFTQ